MPSRERAVALALLVLAVVLAVTVPAYFAPENLRDLFLANLPVLIVALGATLVIVTGEIDISCGSMFAVCSVVAGSVGKATGSVFAACLAAAATGVALGATNGALVAYARIPSIVVTLASMVALRDALRWTTDGAWVTDLPDTFQWFGLASSSYPAVAAALSLLLFALAAWTLGFTAAGRWIYAVGSDSAAARLAGLPVERIRWSVFAVAGLLTALAAMLNAVRFSQIPSNSGLGLEMKVVAAVVVGGAAVSGGVGRVSGTLLGVALLGMTGPALTFLGITAYWERSLQGAIILAAVALEAWPAQTPRVAVVSGPSAA
jgi:rhamnose transport system permease protein